MIYSVVNGCFIQVYGPLVGAVALVVLVILQAMCSGLMILICCVVGLFFTHVRLVM